VRESDFTSTSLQTIKTCSNCKVDEEIPKYKQFVSHPTLNIYVLASEPA